MKSASINNTVNSVPKPKTGGGKLGSDGITGGTTQTPGAPAGAPKGYDRYEAHDNLRTLTQAHSIQKDPKRMAHVAHAAREKLAEHSILAELAGNSPTAAPPKAMAGNTSVKRLK